MKVKDHDGITGKYQGSANQECNLNVSLNKKIPVVFHNLQNYDSNLSFQEFGKCKFKINIIPKTIEKYMAFTIMKPKKKRFNQDLDKYL